MTEETEWPSWYEVAAFLKEKGFEFGADPDTYDYAPCVEVNFSSSLKGFDKEALQIAETNAERAVVAIIEHWPGTQVGPDCTIIKREGWEVWMCEPPPILTYDPVVLLKECRREVQTVIDEMVGDANEGIQDENYDERFHTLNSLIERIDSVMEA